MKFIFFLTVLLTSFSFAYGQPREVTKEDSVNIKKSVDKEAALLKARLEKQDHYLSDEQKQFEIEFDLDTFRINQTQSRYIDIDGSTAGMVEAGFRAEAAYDKLLNKYYKRLLGKLSKEDQETLKKSQRNWVTFRDSERELIYILSKDSYSGGGTMQNLINSSQVLELTQKRVFEIFTHLSRFYY